MTVGNIQHFRTDNHRHESTAGGVGVPTGAGQGTMTPSVIFALLWRGEQGLAPCLPLLAFALGSSSSLAFRPSFSFRDRLLGARVRVWDYAEKAAEEGSGGWNE